MVVQRFTGTQGVCTNGGVTITVGTQVERVCDAPRFRIWGIQGGGVVFDEQTGAMWQRHPATGTSFPVLNYADAVAYCAGLTFAGFSDWRMAGHSSMVALIQLGQTPVAPTIDRDVFPNTPELLFWTDEFAGADPLGVSFIDGNPVVALSDLGTHLVRCMR